MLTTESASTKADGIPAQWRGHKRRGARLVRRNNEHIRVLPVASCRTSLDTVTNTIAEIAEPSRRTPV
jgi:hypothetical protein